MYNAKNPSPNFLSLENFYKKIHKEGIDEDDPSMVYNGISTMVFAEIIKKIIEKNKLNLSLSIK